jgi:hypothetical protein
MKRSATKQKIRNTEIRLASEVTEWLARWHVADDDWKDGTLKVLGWWITDLLGLHLQLDDSWSRDRWLDGIEEVSIAIEGANVLQAKGILYWGLLSNIGGAQTSEPFEGVICLTGIKRRPLAYLLTFGKDQERRHFSRGDLTLTWS